MTIHEWFEKYILAERSNFVFVSFPNWLIKQLNESKQREAGLRDAANTVAALAMGDNRTLNEYSERVKALEDALKTIQNPSNWDGIYLPKIDCQVIAAEALATKEPKV